MSPPKKRKQPELSHRQIEVLNAIGPTESNLGDLGEYFSIHNGVEYRRLWAGLQSTLRSLDRLGLVTFTAYEVKITAAGRKRLPT